MRAMKRLAAMVVLAAAVQSTASAQVQFYNGSPDGVVGFSSEVNSTLSGGFSSMVYENYTVGASGMTVTGLFGNYFAIGTSALSWSSAAWEIRSGMSHGNGGTLLFSGTSAVTTTATGQFVYGGQVHQAKVDGLNYFLTGGEYWFGLSPLSSSTTQFYLATTAGASGVNANLDHYAIHHMPIAPLIYDGNVSEDYDFSLGVEGRIAESTVPEPATMTLLATGLAGLAGARRRKRTNA